MKQMSPAMLSLLLLFAANGLQAQVYESTDEAGNSVFTDVPPTDDSKPLNLGSPNIADSVEVRPPAPEQPPAEKTAPASAAPSDATVMMDGDDDLREDLYEERRRRELNDRRPAAEAPVNRPAVSRPAPHPARR